MENENESRQNNFNFLRLIAASCVIISHSFSLLKYDQIDYLGILGVTIFFIISGYLITQSWVHSPHPGKFIKKRLLRIIPALVFCTLFTMFLIGPLTTNLTLIKYLGSFHTWSYLANILLYPLQFTLPGVFLKNPSFGLVNHSLWTLPVEFTAYLLIVLFGMLKLLKKPLIILGLLLLISMDIYLRNFSFYAITSLYNFGINGIVPYFIYFFLGSAIYLLRIKIRFNVILFAVSMALFTAAFFLPVFFYSYFFALPYMVFSLAFLKYKIPFFRKTDLSYGMYLFSMPIQQMFISFFPGIMPLILLVISFTATVPIAFISWNFIESKALLLKKHV